MSIIIFFGFCFFILALGLIVIGVTFYQWKKQKIEIFSNQPKK